MNLVMLFKKVPILLCFIVSMLMVMAMKSLGLMHGLCSDGMLV